MRKLGTSAVSSVALRRSNMDSRRTFVKRVNTTYCAFLLGQSQDVDACAYLCIFDTAQLDDIFFSKFRAGLLRFLQTGGSLRTGLSGAHPRHKLER